MLTILPPPPLTISRAQACATRNAPVRLIEMILFHSSRPISRNGVFPPTPALLIRMSMRPRASTVDLTMADTEAGSATLTATGTARPPCFSRPAVASSAPSRLISAMTTVAPSRTNALAIASPMPRAPPVMTATLSLSRMTVSSLSS